MKRSTHRRGSRFRFPSFELSPGATAHLLALLLVTAAILIGGATSQRHLQDAIVQMLSVPLIGLGLARLLHHPSATRLLLELILLVGVFSLPLVYLIPLPPEVWQAIPGRDVIATTDDIVGLTGTWRPLTFDPEATLRSWISIFPAVALFLFTITASDRERVSLAAALLMVALLSTFRGLDQVIGLFAEPVGVARGFFANRNHLACLLAVSIPLAGALILRSQAKEPGEVLLQSGSLILVLIILFIGIGASQSRAGLAIGALGFLGLVAMISGVRAGASHAGTRPSPRTTLRVTVIAGVVGLLVVAEFAAGGVARLFTTDLEGDYRTVSRSIVSGAAVANLPFGTGFGTFVPVYAMHETPQAVRTEYLNRAHNDWIELTMEGGVFAVALIALFTGWWAYGSLRAWHVIPVCGSRTSLNLARGASIGIGLILLHSLVDYPLRTTSIMCVFAVFAGFLVPSVPRVSAKPGYRRGQSHRVVKNGCVSATDEPTALVASSNNEPHGS